MMCAGVGWNCLAQ